MATGKSSDPAAFRFFNEVGIIEQLARTRFDRVLPKNMSVAQFSVLNHFVRLGGERSLVELARAFQVSKPAMGKLVQRLAAQRLLALRGNPDDSRGKLVSLTPRGAAARDAAIVALEPELVRLQRALGAEVFAASLANLARVRQWLDDNR
jgi:DNA-binding MarR family transcriptional regulator